MTHSSLTLWNFLQGYRNQSVKREESVKMKFSILGRFWEIISKV